MAALMAEGVRFTNTIPSFPLSPPPMPPAWPPAIFSATPAIQQHHLHRLPLPAPATASPPSSRATGPRDVDEHFAGDYLNEETILHAARDAGLSTASIGKLGPASSSTTPSVPASTPSPSTT